MDQWWIKKKENPENPFYYNQEEKQVDQEINELNRQILELQLELAWTVGMYNCEWQLVENLTKKNNWLINKENWLFDKYYYKT